MMELPEKSAPKNILFFTVHKAASMFVYKVCHDLSRETGMKYYSVNHNKRNRLYFDTEESNLENIATWENRTGCFAPLRYFFKIPTELNAAVVLHLRDPRDVLVSLYYSEAFSHSVIKGVFELGQSERDEIRSKGIDLFVLKKAEDFNRKYDDYRALLTKPNAIFVKYEDLVLDFPYWLDAVAKGFGIEKRKCIDNICNKYKREFDVKIENIHAHKRKIIPGDYKEKLKPETISKLNAIFADNLERYGYGSEESEVRSLRPEN